ncbi:MAG: glycosyl transferase, partial [Tannerellaceae bacterium]|nr:glycosyl transferase [Tannerellaceae bacterium]
MIPKIIHYCWFGKKEKPGKISKCIESWRRMLPDYQIIEWNEDNFDYESIEYAKSAYRNGKFAFVSDVARLRALIEYGGIYLDTDVEVLKSFDDLLNYHCVFGMEERNYIATSFMACEPQFPLIQEFFNTYK